MPQGETYLPPSLAYSNRYLSYPVPESLSLSHLQLSGKGPVYPHPVLLSTNSLYSARLPPKPGIPYGIPPSHGEYLTYHDSQEMVHPLMSPHLPLDHKVTERLELRHRPLDKPWHHNEAPYKRQSITDTDPSYKSERESERQEVFGSRSQSKPHTVNKDEIVCIDLVQDDTDGSPEPDKHSAIDAKCKDGSNSEGKEPELMQILRSGQPAVSWPTDSERQAEVCSPPRPQKQSDSPDDEEGHGLSKSKRSSLAKRIANSSGYVGDRFKCVTTELYADSSKLSREQRALQVSSAIHVCRFG
uniref:BCL6 corepressor n=1 Tax=Cyprinus carpio TaxID=7962 RepID=A0A8C2FDV2_CYPCA